MGDTPVIDMELDMIEAELNSTNTSDAPATATFEPTTNQANIADGTLCTNRFDRPEAIYLLGLDNMNTKDIQHYCQNTALKKVEWIDDSSCVLVFENDSDAKLAAQELLQETHDTVLNSSDLRNAKPFERPDFTESNDAMNDTTLPPVRPVIDHLQIRLATDSDVKTRGSRHRSRYYLIHGEPPSDPSNNNNSGDSRHSSRSHRTTSDGKPLSILDRLGSRVPPLSAQRRGEGGRYRHQHTDRDEDDSSSRYDRYSRSRRRDEDDHHRRRRSLSPTRDAIDRPIMSESENGATPTDKMDDIPPPPTTSAEEDDKPYEIPESIRSRLGNLE
ncbi:hypothetical protein BCR42DRAFT_415367 [Absidia repens]|uniref:Uncharacterized protein n=1 Tax=Absidia repens TaxID=90262 RepID=A0A1X2IJ32_9FUNG|nr:hypothetical protein BCR42DRAFT_415367 [Absidia repens]